MKLVSIALGSALAAVALPSVVHAVELGTATVTGEHWAYSGSGQGAAANNTRRTIGPFTGFAKRIHITGTLTTTHSAAWPKSLRVQPSSTGLASGQPWFQFSTLSSVPNGTVINVDQWAYVPKNGWDLSKPINLEMFSIDSEQFVPGRDGTSNLTYTFHDSYAPGTVEFSGQLTAADPKMPRRWLQGHSSSPSGFGTVVDDPGRHPHHQVQPFFVSATGRYDIAQASEYEASLYLYRNAFDPNATYPNPNILAARDGSPNVFRDTSFNSLPLNGDAVGGSSMMGTLTAGVQYFLISTALNDTVENEGDGGPFLGRYTNVIAPVGHSGEVTLGMIPEPSALGAVVVLLPLLRRRRN